MKSTNSANWILVTGTSSGIGRAATFTLAENGYRVLAAVRKQLHPDHCLRGGEPSLLPGIDGQAL